MGIVHISGWVQITDPAGAVDPGYGRPGGGWGGPADPGYGRPGWSPADPGYGVGGGLHPSHGLPGGGHISTGPIKPPGRPIIPTNPIYTPPPAHPWFPGHWEPVDPGFGRPPIFGWFPVDPGFGQGGGSIDNTLPSNPGHWVPTDPDYGMPVHGCPEPKPPIWAWIPEIDPGFGIEAPVAEPK